MQAAGQRLSIKTFLEQLGPILDVRSPGEFAQGHIPGAHNLPLFSDEERALVGTAYKQQGRATSVDLGLNLVGPKLAALGNALAAHGIEAGDGQASLRIHCWRGGMRSSSMAWLAGLVEQPCVLLEGGYKAYRHWVLGALEKPWPLVVLGGRTGTGKTDLLLALQRRGRAVVDLEGLAQHRGSSFGGLGLPPQPSTEHYENRLATALQGCRHQGAIWLEAESAQVGRCRIPAGLWRQMQAAPVVEILRPMEERLGRLVNLYGIHGREPLREATQRIAKRLGPQRSRLALEAIDRFDWHGACSQMLDYYDRCYDHDLGRRQAPLCSLDLAGLNDQQSADQLLLQALP